MTMNELQNPVRVEFHLRSSHGIFIAGIPELLDLSGNSRLLLNIRVFWNKLEDDDIARIIFERQETSLDIPFALHKGFLECYDRTASSRLDFDAPSTDQSKDCGPGTLDYHTEPLKHPYSFDVDLNSVLEGQMQPDHDYRVSLHGPILGRNCQLYGHDGNIKLTTASYQIVADGTTYADFRTIPVVKIAPSVSISLKLSKSCITMGDEMPITVFAVLVNRSHRQITIKSTAKQPSWPGPVPVIDKIDSVPLVVSRPTKSDARMLNFSTMRLVDDVDIYPSKGYFSGLVRYNRKYCKREDFTTLLPGEPLHYSVEILNASHQRSADTGGYRISLRPRPVWWCEGTIEDLFGEADTLPWDQLPKEPRIPLLLASDDVLRLDILARTG